MGEILPVFPSTNEWKNSLLLTPAKISTSLIGLSIGSDTPNSE